MKPVEPRHNSDCVATVLAAVLELPIEDVPDFWREGKTPAGWQYQAVRRWLAGQGYHWYYSECSPRHLAAFLTEEVEPGCSWPPRGYWIGQISRVEWLRDNDPTHVVVMKNRRCVFNPSGPTRQVLEPDVWLIGYYLLVPLDPVQHAAQEVA